MGYTNGSFNHPSTNGEGRVGPPGPPGPPGNGFKTDASGNFSIEGKKIVSLGEPQGETDAVNKKYTDTKFLPLDGSKPMKDGLVMQGGRIEGLPEKPYGQWDATSKIYVNSEDAKVRRYVDTKVLEKDESGNYSVEGKKIVNLGDPQGDK